MLLVPRSTVSSIWSKFIVNKSYANVKSTGRRKKFTVRDERKLIRCALANKKLSWPKRFVTFNGCRGQDKMSLITMRRILKKHKFKSYSAPKKILLSKLGTELFFLTNADLVCQVTEKNMFVRDAVI